MEAAMAIATLQSDEQIAALSKSWIAGLCAPFMAARQKQAEARLTHLASQRSSFAKAKVEQARAELRMYSI
jgi:hypothetical protein